MNKLLVAIPSYNRFDLLLKTLIKYKDYELDILVFGQGYSDEQLKVLKTISSKIKIINYSEPMGIGYIRKNMFEYIFEVLEKRYDYLIMHDDDICLEKSDMLILSETLELRNDLNMSTIDIYNLCSGLDYIESDIIFTIGCFRISKLQKIYKKLITNIKANEDSELVYLMGNKGLVINQNKFITKLDEEKIHSDTVINNRKIEFEKSADVLKQKYGDNLIISRTDKSQNVITKFNTYIPKIIYFEGIDRSGKSSLLKEFNELSDFQFYTSDRSPISTIAYGRIFSRNIDEKFFMNYLEENKNDIIIIYTFCSNNKIKERLQETQHQEYNINVHRIIFDDIINELDKKGFNIIKINTNKVSQMSSSKEILTKIIGGLLK